MLGFKYLKVPPTTHVIQYRRGRVVREGAGLSFFLLCAFVGDRTCSAGKYGCPFRVQ